MVVRSFFLFQSVVDYGVSIELISITLCVKVVVVECCGRML